MTLKRLVTAAGLLGTGITVLVVLSLPSRRAALSASADDGTIPGVIHVHTNRSDGRGTPADIAKAAERAGLKFVVYTDHGDGARRPDPPVYRGNVLCLDGVEISTNGGHYIALDMEPAPYRLGGDARDVVEDVARLGGFGIVAHPDSPKAELAWHEWEAPFDAIELVNPDTSWRSYVQAPDWQKRLRLAKALLAYPVRPAEAIASLLTESSLLTTRWVGLTRRRPVVAVAGADAHASLGWRDIDPRGRLTLPLPSYEATFRTLSLRVRVDRALSGEAPADAATLMSAIRHGHVYTSLDGLAAPPSFVFTAENKNGLAHQGDELRAGGPTTLRVRTNAPMGYTLSVWQDDRLVASGGGPELLARVPDKGGVYRAQIHASRANQPAWILSNPIYVRHAGSDAPLEPAPGLAVDRRLLFDGATTAGWGTEQDGSSAAALDVSRPGGRSELRLRFRLSSTDAPESFAAVVTEIPGNLAEADRLVLTARADRPLRLSVQFRTRMAGVPHERWHRTVYLDSRSADRTIAVSDLMPIGDVHHTRAPLSAIRDVLFVIDRTNSRPGTSGTIWIASAALETPRSK